MSPNDELQKLIVDRTLIGLFLLAVVVLLAATSSLEKK